MTSKSDSIGVTCTRLWHFADTFSQWNSCWKKINTWTHDRKQMWLPDAHLCYFILSAARPCVAVLLHGAATSSAISPQMHQQNPADAPPESRGTTRIRRTPTESCLHLQRESVSVWGLTSQMCAWGSTSHKCTRFEMQTQRTRCTAPVGTGLRRGCQCRPVVILGEFNPVKSVFYVMANCLQIDSG